MLLPPRDLSCVAERASKRTSVSVLCSTQVRVTAILCGAAQAGGPHQRVLAALAYTTPPRPEVVLVRRAICLKELDDIELVGVFVDIRLSAQHRAVDSKPLEPSERVAVQRSRAEQVRSCPER